MTFFSRLRSPFDGSNLYEDIWREDRRTHAVMSFESGSDGICWAVLRHQEAKAVLADPQTFGSSSGIRLGSDPQAVAAASGKTLLVSDPPDHRRLRQALAPMFSPSGIDALRITIDNTANQLVSEFAARGGGDFVEHVARVLPAAATCQFLGLPPSEERNIALLAEAALAADSPRERQWANAELFGLASSIADEPQPADPNVRLAIEAIGFETTLLNVHGILLAANETTRFAAAGAVCLIDASLGFGNVRSVRLPTLVEEVLRFTCPGMHVLRTTTRPCLIGGRQLPKGARVSVWLASANRDDTIFDRPQEFRPTRSPNPHLTFGAGPHTCIGAKLARIQLTALLSAVGDHLAAFRVTQAPEIRQSTHIRGPEKVMVQRARAQTVVA